MPQTNQIQLSKMLEFLYEHPEMFENVMDHADLWTELTEILNEFGVERTTGQWKKVNKKSTSYFVVI